MIKQTLHIVFNIFLCTTILGQHTNNDVEKMNLKGKIKTITILPYAETNEKGEVIAFKSYHESPSETDTRLEFNENGFKILEIKNYSNASSSYKITFLYKERNKLLEKNEFNTKGINISKTTYTYDSLNRLMESNNYHIKNRNSFELKHTSKQLVTYDERNNQIDDITQDINGRIVYKRTNKYNIVGQKIESSIYFETELKTKAKFKYNEKGLLINEIQYNSIDSITNIFSYKYNEAKLVIEKISEISIGDNDYKEKIKYDNKNRVIEKTIFKKDSLMLKENYLYDQKNNLVEIITFYNKTNQKVMI